MHLTLNNNTRVVCGSSIKWCYFDPPFVEQCNSEAPIVTVADRATFWRTWQPWSSVVKWSEEAGKTGTGKSSPKWTPRGTKWGKLQRERSRTIASRLHQLKRDPISHFLFYLFGSIAGALSSHPLSQVSEMVAHACHLALKPFHSGLKLYEFDAFIP